MAGAIRTTASRTSVCPAVRTTENDRHQQSGTDHGLYCELNYVVFVFIQHLHEGCLYRFHACVRPFCDTLPTAFTLRSRQTCQRNYFHILLLYE